MGGEGRPSVTSKTAKKIALSMVRDWRPSRAVKAVTRYG